MSTANVLAAGLASITFLCAATANSLANENGHSYFLELTNTCTGVVLRPDRDGALLIDMVSTAKQGVFPVVMMDGKQRMTVCASKEEIEAGIAERQKRFDKYHDQEVVSMRNMATFFARGQFEKMPMVQQTPEAWSKLRAEVEAYIQEENRKSIDQFNADIKSWRDAAEALKNHQMKLGGKKDLSLEIN